jgi:alkanesulfonate monooxygenase SsuD/methylene tetrahydromethanopterin reductase-like flavin-dependent oxidoreductase (luciferase family)
MPAESLDKQRRATFVADLNRALDLVAGHFDSAWMVDHLQFADADVLEGFTALTYMAALHPQLKFGHAVLCQSFRNPALLAKMGATLHFMSGGRFILGMGAGWHAEEYTAYGYDFPPGRVRVEQLAEALHIIRAMWTQEKATFEGKYYRVIEARCEPRPDPLPPLMVGAFKPKMLRLAARYADWSWPTCRPAGYTNTVSCVTSSSAPAPRSAATRRPSGVRGSAAAPAPLPRRKPSSSPKAATVPTTPSRTLALSAPRSSSSSRCAPSSTWAWTISC